MKSMTAFMSGSILLRGPRSEARSPRLLLHRQTLPIAPLLPRPGVVADARITEQAQSEIGVRGAIATLAVGHDFLVGRHAGLLVHRAQLGGRFERAVRSKVARPLHVHRAWNAAAALGTDRGALPLTIRARVEQDDIGIADTGLDIAPRRDRAFLRRAGPGALGRRLRLPGHRELAIEPRVEAAVEHPH